MTTVGSPSPYVDAGRVSPTVDRTRRRWRRALLAVPLLIAAVGAGLIGVALGGLGGTAVTLPTATVATSMAGTVAPVAATTPVATVAGLTDVSDVAAVVIDSVVKIEITAVFRGREAVVASGSGVIVDGAGTIVTNAHVVEGARSGVEVILTDGTTHAGTVVTVDDAHDLAIVSIDAGDLTPIELGSADGLLVGDPVIAVGNPLGLEGDPSVSTGIVSALDRTLEDAGSTLTGIIQTDAAITEGSSGGALLDGTGRLIGITTAVGVSSVGIEGMGFAVPVEAITALLAASPGV